MINLNTNLSSLITQRSLATSTQRLNQAIEQMTTGFKINHAKDNAANYNITTNMTTKIGAYMVAEDNCAMGLDLLATANGSLDQIADKLQRLRALAVQTSNGTYGEKSKEAINQEANAIIDEIERIYNTTEYNGINLMKGQVTGVEESKFIKDIDRRDTSRMTTLACVDETKALTSGTYSISTAEELAKLATMTDNGLIGADTEFVLANDIDLQAWCDAHNATGGWNPIGASEWNGSLWFQATFDGNGYEISNLIINRDQIIQGLFAGVKNANIKNLGLKGVNINGRSYCGALAGSVYTSTLENIYANGDIVSTQGYSGGVVGELAGNGSMNSCYSKIIINGPERLGGICGVLGNSCLENCFAQCEINVNGAGRSGGIYGHGGGAQDVYSIINNCYSDCIINSSNGWGVGGIGGISAPLIMNNTYSNSQINSVGTTAVGGLIGVCYTGDLKINNCSVLKDSAGLTGIYVGELSSSRTSTLEITDCTYTTGITSTNTTIAIKGSIDPVRYSESGSNVCDGALPFEILTSANVTNLSSNLQLQIGINSSVCSKLSLDSGYSIDGVSFLRKIGNSSVNYLEGLDRMLLMLSNKQTEYGAMQNRLESALDEISVQYENLVSSRSTLRDADISEVSSEYIRQQILQQASATLMATANQSPSIALQLI